MALGELKNGIGPDAYAIYQQVLAAVVERDHPVGSLYFSENATSPAELYGGTWERIEGKFIMGASDTYPAGSTGGEEKVSLTEDNNGPHAHYASIANFSSGDKLVPENEWRLVYKDPGASTSHLMRSILINGSGKGKPHNNMPPYITKYVWQRIE